MQPETCLEEQLLMMMMTGRIKPNVPMKPETIAEATRSLQRPHQITQAKKLRWLHLQNPPSLTERVLARVEKAAHKREWPLVGEVVQRLDGGETARIVHLDLLGLFRPSEQILIWQVVSEAARLEGVDLTLRVDPQSFHRTRVCFEATQHRALSPQEQGAVRDPLDLCCATDTNLSN